MVHPVLAYFLDKKHQQQNVPGLMQKFQIWLSRYIAKYWMKGGIIGA